MGCNMTLGHVMSLVSASHDATGICVLLHHWHWHQHHGMQRASSMAPFHSLGQDFQTEGQQDLFGL